MNKQGVTAWDVVGHDCRVFIISLAVFALVVLLDWLLGMSEYPQG